MTAPHPADRRDPAAPRGPARRVQRNFWMLLAAAVLATGMVSRAVAQEAGPATGALLAVSGLAALVSASLAARILVVIRHPQKNDPQKKGEAT